MGKSVASTATGQLKSMLSYKCYNSGRKYIQVPSRNSTSICNVCGAITGPKGRAELSVRNWECGQCGAVHDRDINAAINTLNFGAGIAHEELCYA